MPETARQPEFAWRAHPAAERLPAAAAAAAVVLAIGAATWVSFTAAWGILAVVVLVGSLNRFFFPSRFAIDDEGITASFPLSRKRLQWAEARRFVVDDRGGYLSTRARRSLLDPHRGMHVLFGAVRGEAIARIRAHLPPGGGER